MGDYDGALLSYGGGVNTVAMLVRLVNEGWHGPIVFADTGGEHPETYCHIKYMEEWMKPHGLEITRLSFADGLDYDFLRRAVKIGGGGADNVIGRTLEEYCLHRKLVPLLSVRWCSVMYKQALLKQYLTDCGLAVSLRGIGSDEPGRIRNFDDAAYPLNDWGWTRRDCIEYIKAQGIPLPRKSGCFFCPAQKRSKWRDLWRDNSDLYERAAVMERVASQRCGKKCTLQPDGILSLDEMRIGFESQSVMDFANEPEMRAYEPCICGL
jgi:3'-phosphoadenosine 5'-phosphosulfate sulfotransferase (PAPS reductase)/FAD synthetase